MKHLQQSTSAAADRTIATDRTAAAERTAVLFERLAGSTDRAAREAVLEEVVLINLPWIRRLAGRYRDRGIPSDDLFQVASLGLVRAAHGFDPGHGSDFMAYAAPTVRGELKRHFRDTGWAVRPPRRLQELRPRLAGAVQELTQQLGRAPTTAELADHLDVSVEDVVETMLAGNGYAALSTDAPSDSHGGDAWVHEVKDLDSELDSTPERLALQQLLARLPDRERRILALRFFAEKTQSEIGAEVGITQMQVSRLLSASLARLREQLTG